MRVALIAHCAVASLSCSLGEVIHSLRRDPSNTRQTMWARDSPTPKDQNIYGVHPFHMEMRNGKAHGAVCVESSINMAISRLMSSIIN